MTPGTLAGAVKEGELVCPRGRLEVWVASGFWERLGGVFVRPVSEERGLLFLPCRAVHGFFLPFPLDVVFFDREGRVRKVGRLRPWGMLADYGAFALVELWPGLAGRLGLGPGARVFLKPRKAREG
jgi:uncharacterized membrane protein (UPF0127 family)